MAEVVKYILEVSTKNASAELKKMGDNSTKAGKGFDGLGKSSKGASGGMKKLAMRAGAVGIAIGGAAVAISAGIKAVVGFGKAVFSLTQEVVDGVNRLNDLSTASNISAETIQGLEFAFRASGQSIGAADAVVQRFPKTLAALIQDGSDAQKVVKALGVETLDASGKMRSSDDIFKDLIGTLQGLEDAQMKSQAATAIFGRQAGNLMIALGNSAPLESFVKFTKEFGIDAETNAKKAAFFQQKLAALGVVFTHLKNKTIESIGGIEFFNKAMREIVGAVVFVATLISSFSEEIKAMGNAIVFMVRSALAPMINAFIVMGKLAPSVANDLGNILVSLKVTKAGGLFTNVESRLQGAFDASKKAKAGIDEFTKELKESQKGIVPLSQNLKELDAALKRIKDDQKGAGDGAGKEAAKAASKVKQDTDRAKEALKTLIAMYRNTEVSAARAFERTKKLTRIFGDLKIPTEPIVAFRAELEKALDAQKLEEFKAKQNEATQGFNDLKAAFQAGKVDIDGALEKSLDFAKSFDSLELSKTQVDTFVESLKGMKRETARLDKIKGKIELTTSFISAATTAEGAIMTGLKAGLTALAGPLGGVLGGLVESTFGTLKALGEKTPEEMEKEGVEFAKAVSQGILNLPAILFEVLPVVLFQLAARLIAAIARLPFEIVGGIGRALVRLYKSITDFFGGGIKETVGNMWESTKSFFGDAFRGLGGDSKYNGGPFVPSAYNGMRFTGSRGLAMLHQGEVVIPRSGRASQGVQRRLDAAGGGAGMNITINSAVVDGSVVETLVRQIEEKFQLFGSAQSTLF